MSNLHQTDYESTTYLNSLSLTKNDTKKSKCNVGRLNGKVNNLQYI